MFTHNPKSLRSHRQKEVTATMQVAADGLLLLWVQVAHSTWSTSSLPPPSAAPCRQATLCTDTNRANSCETCCTWRVVYSQQRASMEQEPAHIDSAAPDCRMGPSLHTCTPIADQQQQPNLWSLIRRRQAHARQTDVHTAVNPSPHLCLPSLTVTRQLWVASRC